MKFSEITEDQRQVHLTYIDTRWKQLHELEIKRGDAVLNYLFLVSGGASAATLAYIGNLAKDGAGIPLGAIWMLGCFATSLLLVGLMKARLVYHVAAIYKSWRSSVRRYFDDEISWSDMQTADEAAVKKNASLVYFLGWGAYFLLLVGVAIGFVKLQEEITRGRPQTPPTQNPDTLTHETADRSKGQQDRKDGTGAAGPVIHRDGTSVPAASPTKEKVN